MTSAERAKELARIIRDVVVAESNGKFDADDTDGRLWFECSDSNAAVDCEIVAAAILPLITQAITQAQNDKLEEAAAIVTAAISIKSTTFKVDGRQLEDDNGETVFVTASRVNELLGTKAAAIRSLIQKD